MNDYRKLERQPLQFVLAEFRFSRVMQIGQYIPNIQESLRKQYPMLHQRQEQEIQVQAGGIAVSTIEQWTFVAKDKKSAIELNQDRLVYITADYPRFEGFAESCRQALETLAEIVEPSLILRIGLRYSDLVRVEENESVSDLVDMNFTYPDCLSALGTPQQNRTETYLMTEAGGLVIRTLYGVNNLSCLQDAQSLPVQIDHDTAATERMILDFDHFWEAKDESISFETDDILEKLSKLHKTSRETFWNVTTDYARNQKWS